MKSEFEYLDVNSLVLACDASDNWKTCSWKHHSIDTICRFTYVSDNVYVWKVTKDGCGDKFGSPKFEQDSSTDIFNNRVCEISISYPKLKHIGEWECELESCNLKNDGGCKTESNESAIAIGKIIVEVTY